MSPKEKVAHFKKYNLSRRSISILSLYRPGEYSIGDITMNDLPEIKKMAGVGSNTVNEIERYLKNITV